MAIIFVNKSFLILALIVASCYHHVVHSQSAALTDSSLSCSNNFFLMEQSLLQDTDNRFNLLKAFFPARDPHPVLVRANYTFRGGVSTSMSETSPPGEVWFWSESEFYLIQPLEVFQFTSLLFGNTPNRMKDLNLTLDSNCTDAPSEYFLHLTARVRGLCVFVSICI